MKSLTVWNVMHYVLCVSRKHLHCYQLGNYLIAWTKLIVFFCFVYQRFTPDFVYVNDWFESVGIPVNDVGFFIGLEWIIHMFIQISSIPKSATWSFGCFFWIDVNSIEIYLRLISADCHHSVTFPTLSALFQHHWFTGRSISTSHSCPNDRLGDLAVRTWRNQATQTPCIKCVAWALTEIEKL